MSEGNKNPNTASGAVELLWLSAFFIKERNLSDVSRKINKKWENNFPAPELSKALSKARFLMRTGKRGFYKYKQRISAKGQEVESVEHNLFSQELTKKLEKNFGKELDDLRLNFGNSGSCSAFLLRKILEKLIYIVFARNGIENKIENNNLPGGLIGLEKMIDIASKEKVGGIPILMPKTASKVKGMKFLGDASAHNPLINIDMEDILPQMPFIITAYKELAQRL